MDGNQQQQQEEEIVDANRKFKITKPQLLEDGKHSGKIVRVIYRSKPYNYVDVYIKPDEAEADFELKAGYPQMVSENSALGKLLGRFGCSMNEGEEVNPHELLMDRRVEFVTITEPVTLKDKSVRDFARIVRESVKPEKEKTPVAAQETVPSTPQQSY